MQNKEYFAQGLKYGLPIGLGYLAVAFSLGITAARAGITPAQGFFASALTMASAGEYAAFVVIASSAPYFALALTTLVTNARYLLMSCSLTQRFSPDTPFYHRFIIACGLTDEMFGVAIAQDGYIVPAFYYGMMTACVPLWAAGTALGAEMGALLPASIVTALSVSIFGMFLAIVIPPARKSRAVAVVVTISFTASFAFSRLPLLSSISEGTRTLILAVMISALAAVIAPVREMADSADAEEETCAGDASPEGRRRAA